VDNRTYLNKQVSEIVGITPRQVLSWSEKGLIVSFQESAGVGTKRNYDYINLLEFGLCKKLLFLGIGFRALKKMLNELRNTRSIREWANDFPKYYRETYERNKDHLNKLIEEDESEGDIKGVEFLKEFKKKFFQKPDCPKEPMGVLVYYFDKDGEQLQVIPWEAEYVINLNIIREAFANYGVAFLVDMGRIKKEIDSKI